MLLKKAIQKTNIFLHQTLQNLTSFLFRGYQKLPKSRPHNPQNLSNRNSNMHQLDHFYTDHFDDSDNEKMMMKKNKMPEMSVKEPIKEEETCGGLSFLEFEKHGGMSLKNNHQQRKKEEKKIGCFHEGKREEAYMLAQMMEDLEMMEMNDVDHVLDIEEVLHCYCHLTCPIYLDIFDKFFMDTCSEFFLPPPVPLLNISSS